MMPWDGGVDASATGVDGRHGSEFGDLVSNFRQSQCPVVPVEACIIALQRRLEVEAFRFIAW
jgi:hypothetical protein